jgi:limonene-1,2-epoxide hydrolase
MSDGRIDVIKAVMGAWARHDIDELLGHIAEDIEWHYQVGSRPVIGRDNMRKMLTKLKDHQLDSQWRLVRYAEAEDSVMIEAVDDYRNPAGHRVQAPYMGVYEFDGELINAWRDYVDLGLMMKGEAGEPLGEWLEPLIAPVR